MRVMMSLLWDGNSEGDEGGGAHVRIPLRSTEKRNTPQAASISAAPCRVGKSRRSPITARSRGPDGVDISTRQPSRPQITRTGTRSMHKVASSAGVMARRGMSGGIGRLDGRGLRAIGRGHQKLAHAAQGCRVGGERDVGGAQIDAELQRPFSIQRDIDSGARTRYSVCYVGIKFERLAVVQGIGHGGLQWAQVWGVGVSIGISA